MTDEKKLLKVPVGNIVPNRHQPRTEFDTEKLKDLAASIETNGLLQPIVVRSIDDVDGVEYEIIAGERRWRATAEILELDEIEVLVRDVESDNPEEESAVVAIVENLSREDLNPMEEASAFAKLAKLKNWSARQVAEHLGLSRPVVSNAIGMLKLPVKVQAHVSAGLLDKHQAIALRGVKDGSKAEALAIQSIKEGWKLKTLKAAIEKVKDPEGKAASKKKAATKKGAENKPVARLDHTNDILIICDNAEMQAAVKEKLAELEIEHFCGADLEKLL